MDFAESYSTIIFHTYVPQKVHIGRLHPDPIVETRCGPPAGITPSALAAVAPPDVFYDLHFPAGIIDGGLLSSLQLETVIYASQRHQLVSPAGFRCGFLLGDGAGVGKGRQLAGVIVENWLQWARHGRVRRRGRRKAVWISESADLVYDCKRDLKDIGFECIPVGRTTA